MGGLIHQLATPRILCYRNLKKLTTQRGLHMSLESQIDENDDGEENPTHKTVERILIFCLMFVMLAMLISKNFFTEVIQQGSTTCSIEYPKQVFQLNNGKGLLITSTPINCTDPYPNIEFTFSDGETLPDLTMGRTLLCTLVEERRHLFFGLPSLIGVPDWRSSHLRHNCKLS
jgi:hypothetical protein